MSAVLLVEMIEADLVQTVRDHLGHFFSRQLPPGRGPIVSGDVAEVEIRLQVREAEERRPDSANAYVVLREYTVWTANRPTMYWYGLAQRLPTGAWRLSTDPRPRCPPGS